MVGSSVPFLGDEVIEDGGALGVRRDGVEILPCVSQGAAPLGPEMTVTAAEGNVISELAGKPAMQKLREVIEDLPERHYKTVARTVTVRSIATVNLIAGDTEDCRYGISSRIRSTVSMMLAPGCRKTTTRTAGLPSASPI